MPIIQGKQAGDEPHAGHLSGEQGQGAHCPTCGQLLPEVSRKEQARLGSMLAQLSLGQRQVLGYLLQGFTEPQIAQTLRRSRHTIHDHTKAIYVVCGVSRRVHLVRLFEGVDPEDLIAGKVPQNLQ
jgi:DNA-binding NarL/FixJ family response regulator